MRRLLWVALVVLFAMAVTIKAGPPAGAIFTTVADGSEVNYNIYPAKEAVYLDGGPGMGAPQHAAALDDGIYVFQVTDPSGKTLLSTDPAGCRLFEVYEGIIVALSGSCTSPHLTGQDVDHPPAITVQLMPYADTPNPGGEYKVWVTGLTNYLCATDLGKVDCNVKSRYRGTAHGFVPKFSKTDNWKIRGTPLEIDTRFWSDGTLLDGRMITHTDPLGGTNIKWSYLDVAHDINHEAHVEAVEVGSHLINITDQIGCTVGDVYVNNTRRAKSGPQTVTVNVPDDFYGYTVFVDVTCK